jgi:predicted TIM-barrel fold metal-dependent hydrolase
MPAEEAALDAGRPIIDPHLHLWDIAAQPGLLQEPQRFLLPELLAMREASGHNVTHTVFVECGQMYRGDGPVELRPVGENEFVNGVAAMAASGRYGPCLVAHRIVGSADLRRGARVRPVLDLHRARAGERFRGIRMPVAYSEAGMFGAPAGHAQRGLLLDAGFREGARVLAEMDLSLDVWCLHTQLGELIDFADALPDLAIVLDHIGTPEVLGIWAGREAEARAAWTAQIAELARRPNVTIKIGGMGMDIGRAIGAETGPATSGELAARWRPYVETCVAAFTPQRAMFESNFPPDKMGGSYGATWNAFKRVAADYSDNEQDHLFRRTAAGFYRIELD